MLAADLDRTPPRAIVKLHRHGSDIGGLLESNEHATLVMLS